MHTWKDKVVVVTGGSEGLGLSIVEVFAQAGARVVSIARNLERNQGAMERLVGNGLQVAAYQADVTQDSDVKRVVEQIVSEFGQIDVWVNNVGRSTRANVMETSVDVYTEFLEINFLFAVRCWQFCKDELIKSSGHLVNVGSLASKTGWPWMSPYSTSKHALAAFSQQLRLEGPSNVHFLHVCPGPIIREDQNRYAEQSAGLDERAKQAGAGARIKGLAPSAVADKIKRACEKRMGELILPWSARILFSIAQLSSRWGDFLIRKSLKK